MPWPGSSLAVRASPLRRSRAVNLVPVRPTPAAAAHRSTRRPRRGAPAAGGVEVRRRVALDQRRRRRAGPRPASRTGWCWSPSTRPPGAGRLDRAWVTPPRAALTFSLLLRPDAVPGRAVAVAAAADRARRGRRRYAAPPACRRARSSGPTTCSSTERKVAGILVERVETPGRGRRRSSASGSTCRSTADELPGRRPRPRWRWPGAGAAGPDRRCSAAVLARLRRTGTTAGAAPAGGGLRPAYLEACSTLGRRRPGRAARPASSLRGRAVDVDDGRAGCWSTTAAGCTSLGAGDVVHVRPA